MKKYRCSCFCSFYKGEKFIKGYLENMLEQTIFSDVEFVFLNCNSPENEEQYIIPITQKYNNVKYIKLDSDPGLYAAWNIALTHCSSDIITNWNIDDRKTVDSIEILVKTLESDSNIDMVYGQLAMSTTPNETYKNNEKQTWFNTQKPSLINFLIHNSPHCMPMWRKRIHNYCGNFTESYDCVSDAELWLKLLIEKGNIKIIEDSVGIYYFNPTGRSSDKTRELSNYREATAMKNNIINSMGCGKLGIDDLITCEENHEFYKLYNEKIKSGIKHIQDKQIIFAGLCRNSGSKLEKRIDYIIKQLNQYDCKYKIILFENDSTDETKTILQMLKQKHNNFDFISKTFNTPQYGPIKDSNRIKLLSSYRTELQNHIKKNYANYDYAVIFDTDFNDISIDGLLNSFGWFDSQKDISAIAGYSFTFKESHGHYFIWNYDSWAYRHNAWTDNITVPAYPLVQTYNTMLAFGFSILPKGSPPITVNSAFGGSAVYKMKDYIVGQYDYYDCEHVAFHKSLHEKNPRFKLVANPSQLMLLSE
jgi:glycosyltransferase involved in cell wall biosynthesis